MRPARVVLLLLPPLLLLAGGCGGGGDQYYRLSPVEPAREGVRAGSGSLVGVGPVNLADYVDRAELVFQSDAYQFQVPGHVRWAGSLGQNITRVLAVDLSRRLGGRRVVGYPWDAAAAVRTRVTLDVQQFHSVSGGDALLDVSWRVEDLAAGGQVRRRGQAHLREPVTGDGYGAVVAAESRLLDRLAAAIAPALE